MKKAKKNVTVTPTSPIQTIKRGIRNQDWQLVIEGYKYLTGDVEVDVNVPEEVTPQPKSKKAGRPKKKAKSAPEEDDSDEIETEDDEPEYNNKVGQIAKVTSNAASAPLGKLRKFSTPFAQAHDPRAKKQSKEIAKRAGRMNLAKQERSPYKPHMLNCFQCRKEFDFNKAYPGGKWGDESRKNIVYCNHCQGAK